PMLEQCKALLAKEPAFVLLTSHTQGVTSVRLGTLLRDVLDGDITSGEMELTGESDVRPVSAGVWARWTRS
ncbi:MAG: hypothetical protein U1E22_01855, partial [Coriobacteriia bacterium]|nr:hypothetical protein [Coriobacteriia bacterium]